MGAGHPVERRAGQSHWEQMLYRGEGQGKVLGERAQAGDTEDGHTGLKEEVTSLTISKTAYSAL